MFKFLILIALFILNFFVTPIIPKYFLFPSVFVVGDIFISFLNKKWRYSIFNILIIILIDSLSPYPFGTVSSAFLVTLLAIHIIENRIGFERKIGQGIFFASSMAFIYYVVLIQLTKFNYFNYFS